MTASLPTWKRHDTWPPLQASLLQAGGASTISLATATQVELVLKSTTLPVGALVTGIMTIASAPAGYVTYNWAKTDLAMADIYNVEFQIAWQAGGIETVPNDVYDQIVVVADLDNA